MEMSIESVMRAMFADMVKQEVAKVLEGTRPQEEVTDRINHRLQSIERALGLDSMDMSLMDRLQTLEKNLSQVERRFNDLTGGESISNRMRMLDEKLENYQEETHNRLREVEDTIEKVDFDDLKEIDFDKVITEDNFKNTFEEMVRDGDIELRVEVA